MATKEFGKKKIWKTLSLFALMVLTIAASVGVTWAAINANVKTSFNVRYTARNVHAIISGSYITGSGVSESLGDDLTFSGNEATGSEQKFTNEPSIVFKDYKDYAEFHYTIQNTSESNGFAVTINLTGLENSNLEISYAAAYRTATDAKYDCNRASLSTMYVKPQSTGQGVLDIGIKLSLLDPTKDVKNAQGECSFFLDGLAEPTDMFNIISGEFEEDPVNTVLQTISGDSTTSVTNMSAIDTLADANTTSEQLIAKANAASINSINPGVSAKGLNSEIIIEIGGFKWTPTYLSRDTEGNAILTLWLADSSELEGLKYDLDQTFDYHGRANFANWQTEISSHRADDYGISYLRCAVLNNGGSYATGNYDNYVATFEKQSSSAFALLTMESLGLTKYIVTPENVSWQQNDASDGWKKDTIWIPSYQEVGNSTVDKGYPGMWKVSGEQYKSPDYCWTRTSYTGTTGAVYILGLNPMAAYPSGVNHANAVRPAFHLNLTKLAADLAA